MMKVDKNLKFDEIKSKPVLIKTYENINSATRKRKKMSKVKSNPRPRSLLLQKNQNLPLFWKAVYPGKEVIVSSIGAKQSTVL